MIETDGSAAPRKSPLFLYALMGIRDNETRMRALGYPVFRLQLAAFAIAGAIAGLAGALLAGVGWIAINLAMLPLIALAAGALIWLAFSSRRTPA